MKNKTFLMNYHNLPYDKHMSVHIADEKVKSSGFFSNFLRYKVYFPKGKKNGYTDICLIQNLILEFLFRL